MNRLLFTSIISFCFILNSYAQDKVKEESKLETFSSKTGTLIETSTKFIGAIGLAEIKTSVIKNLITNEKVKGLRFEKASTKQYGSDAYNFIDEDEISSLQKSIEILKSNIINTTPTSYTEVRFKSRSGFEFGCFWSKSNTWSFYYQVDKYKSDSSVWFKEGDLEKFENIIKDGVERLKVL